MRSQDHAAEAVESAMEEASAQAMTTEGVMEHVQAAGELLGERACERAPARAPLIGVTGRGGPGARSGTELPRLNRQYAQERSARERNPGVPNKSGDVL